MLLNIGIGQLLAGQRVVPCPAVRPPVLALGSLSSVALSSASVSTIYHEGQDPGIMKPDPT
jgi:hypothetical protein